MGIIPHLNMIKACPPSKVSLGEMSPQEAWEKVVDPSWVSVAVCRTNHNPISVVCEVLVSMLLEGVDQSSHRYATYSKSLDNLRNGVNIEASLTTCLTTVAQLNYTHLRKGGSRLDYRQLLTDTVTQFKSKLKLPYGDM